MVISWLYCIICKKIITKYILKNILYLIHRDKIKKCKQPISNNINIIITFNYYYFTDVIKFKKLQ